METEKRSRHFVNIRGKECVQIFLRLNIIGPPTEEQAAPQKVNFHFKKRISRDSIQGGEVQRGGLGQGLHSESVSSLEREINRHGPEVPEGSHEGAS